MIICLAACTTSGPAAERASIVAGRPGGGLELGPIDDDHLKQVIYDGLGARLAKTVAIGEDGEETTELGDFDSFRFAIVKLTAGSDDVSALPAVAPDGMGVEVSGWFMRTASGTGDDRPACTSFDARLTLKRQGGDWVASDDEPVAFGREDPEDCY